MDMVMVFDYKGQVWYRQGMSIKNQRLNLSMILVLRFSHLTLGKFEPYPRHGYCKPSIYYLNHFAQSKNDSRDHAHLHLRHNN